MLGTSGTVTTVAGVHLGLPRYDRSRVDGCWLNTRDVHAVTRDLLARTYEERIAEPCIGRDRADLVLAGCAILEAVLRLWPCERLRVADRGLREGILTTLMVEDGVLRTGRRRRGRR
jgi:exopolyphosphatase/guanosine-5'-triphosphate,3'-diphosphate pyrophosphatase